MNRIVILLLILSANVFSQNNFKEKFEKIKNDILINNINLEKIDLSNEKLNETEIQILKILNKNSGDFDNKEISFISGSAGTTIYSKTDFFKSFLDYYSKSHILQYTIIKLEEKERILSGSDYIIFYWVKTFNPKSKRLLNKIKQTKQIQ
jgi:hypothetical protein